MKSAVLQILLWLTTPACVFAQGIDLSWNDCVGSGREVANQDFACTGTANVSYALVFQFRLAEAYTGFTGAAAYADYVSHVPGALAPFWHFESGGCSNPIGGVKGISLSDDKSRLPGCKALDPWGGDGTGGFEAIAAYGVDFHRAGNGYFVLGAVGAPQDLEAETRYYAFHLLFNNRNRVACAGCADPGNIYFRRLTLESDHGSPPLEVTGPDEFGQCVSLNGAPPTYCRIAEFPITTLTAHPTLTGSGSPIQLDASVSSTTPPTGQVEFFDGAISLGTAPLSSGVASRTVTLADGAHTITAWYSGDTGHFDSRSSEVDLVVGPAPLLVIHDVEDYEDMPTPFAFEINVAGSRTQPVTVDYTVVGGTAHDGGDFSGSGGTLVIPDTASSVLLTIPLVADAVIEPIEQFQVVLSNLSAGTLVDATATGTIIDDDDRALIKIDDVNHSEDVGNFVFTVRLNRPVTNPVAVDYRTRNDSATDPINDYEPAQGTLVIPPGATTGSITVEVHADPWWEMGETFLLVLSNPRAASILGDGIAIGTIQNDDAPPVVSVSDAVVQEEAGTVTFVLSTSYVTEQYTYIEYSTQSGTATSGVDFVGVRDQVTLTEQHPTFNVVVPIIDDDDCEDCGGRGQDCEDFRLVVEYVRTGTSVDPVGVATLRDDADCAVVPTTLSLFEATPVRTGIELRWQFNDRDAARTDVERATASDGPWSAVDGPRRDEGGVVSMLDRAAEPGRTYWYRLVDRASGGPVVLGSISATLQAGWAFTLGPIAPNPSRGATRVEFGLARSADVRLSVVDLQGREVAVLARGDHPAGIHVASWDAASERGPMPAGMYFVRYRADGKTFTQRVVLTP